jgi:phosphoribosylaminoimidazole-succinocarboxamide synthase
VKALYESRLPLPLLHRGKVREMYEVDGNLLLMVASDRVSAFDVVMEQPVPRKGEVLTLITAWWLSRLEGPVAHHLVAAHPDEILEAAGRGAPDAARALEGSRDQWARRALLVRRTRPLPVECVVRGYLAGSAWAEYRKTGALAGEPLPPGLEQSQELDPPVFSPATKAVEGHDENIPFAGVVERLGAARAGEVRELSLGIYTEARRIAGERGILLADTKFEFGEAPDGRLLLIDEVLTPDSSRYWPRESWRVGTSPPSLDKQPIRDWLDALPDWDRTPPPPTLPDQVVEEATDRYLDVFRRLTGTELDHWVPPSFGTERVASGRGPS